jgi:hypothetical protein
VHQSLFFRLRIVYIFTSAAGRRPRGCRAQSDGNRCASVFLSVFLLSSPSNTQCAGLQCHTRIENRLDAMTDSMVLRSMRVRVHATMSSGLHWRAKRVQQSDVETARRHCVARFSARARRIDRRLSRRRRGANRCTVMTHTNVPHRDKYVDSSFRLHYSKQLIKA